MFLTFSFTVQHFAFYNTEQELLGFVPVASLNGTTGLGSTVKGLENRKPDAAIREYLIILGILMY